MRYPAAEQDKQAQEVVPFCFPDRSDTEKLFTKTPGETFSFILTNADGSMRYGYCRRFLGDTPECHVIISSYPSHGLFSQILDIVEDQIVDNIILLQELYQLDMPKPGDSVVVMLGEEEETTFTFARADNTYDFLEYVSYGRLFSLVPLNVLISLFDALLSGRRILIVSSTLPILSSCMLAIKNMVYPFHWQHIFIPILPETLLDYVGAPMPFIIGILQSSMNLLVDQNLAEVIILDVDKGMFIQKHDYEMRLPPTHTATLVKLLKPIIKNRDRFEGRDFSQSIAHAFLHFWVGIWDGYSNFLVPHERFHFDDFLATKNEEEQKFLKGFRETRLCSVFLRERETLKNKEQLGSCILANAKFDDLGTLIKESLPRAPPMYKRILAGKIKSSTKTNIGGRRVNLRCSISSSDTAMHPGFRKKPPSLVGPGKTGNKIDLDPILERDREKQKKEKFKEKESPKGKGNNLEFSHYSKEKRKDKVKKVKPIEKIIGYEKKRPSSSPTVHEKKNKKGTRGAISKSPTTTTPKQFLPELEMVLQAKLAMTRLTLDPPEDETGGQDMFVPVLEPQ